MPLAGGDVQRRPPVEIDAVDVDPLLQELLDPLDVALAGHEEQLHGGVEVLRHGELLGDGAPAVRIERRLPAEDEAVGVAEAGVKRRLAAEAEAAALHADGSGGELAGDPLLQLGDDLHREIREEIEP